jgi:hypothetical protein
MRLLCTGLPPGLTAQERSSPNDGTVVLRGVVCGFQLRAPINCGTSNGWAYTFILRCHRRLVTVVTAHNSLNESMLYDLAFIVTLPSDITETVLSNKPLCVLPAGNGTATLFCR